MRYLPLRYNYRDTLIMESNDFFTLLSEWARMDTVEERECLLLPFTPILHHFRYFEVGNQPIP